MFDEIEDIRQTRKRYNQKMFQSGVSAFRQFEELEASVLQDGALQRKHKELIALSVSIVLKCIPCVEFHVTEALKNGATAAEIQETAALSIVLGGGTAQWPARFAFKVLEDLQPKDAA